MQIASTTYSFLWSNTLSDGFARLRRMGITSCELAVSLPHVDLTGNLDSVACEVLDAAAAAGVRIISVNPVELNLSAANSGIAQASVEQYAAAIELAALVGADTVVIGPGRANSLCRMPDVVSVPRLTEVLGIFSARAEALGVGIGLENVPFGFLQLPSDLVPIVEEIASPALGLTVDAANLHFLGADINEQVRLAAPHLKLAHVSDTKTSTFGHDHLGNGSVNVGEFFDALNEVGYRGDTVFELTSADLDWSRYQSDFRLLEAVGWIR